MLPKRKPKHDRWTDEKCKGDTERESTVRSSGSLWIGVSGGEPRRIGGVEVVLPLWGSHLLSVTFRLESDDLLARPRHAHVVLLLELLADLVQRHQRRGAVDVQLGVVLHEENA